MNYDSPAQKKVCYVALLSYLNRREQGCSQSLMIHQKMTEYIGLDWILYKIKLDWLGNGAGYGPGEER